MPQLVWWRLIPVCVVDWAQYIAHADIDFGWTLVILVRRSCIIMSGHLWLHGGGAGDAGWTSRGQGNTTSNSGTVPLMSSDDIYVGGTCRR